MKLQSIYGQILECELAGGYRDGDQGSILTTYHIYSKQLGVISSGLEASLISCPDGICNDALHDFVNKSQGQSLDFVGVRLEEPFFAHGQLYVASSRVGHPDNKKYAIRQQKDLPANATMSFISKFLTGAEYKVFKSIF